ncbi:hypothetical protein [Ferruginibacter sp. HRS2-29]|uniref:hypothetical protein n=1 Tax=Ferruginibacter sp. HRS2-29 TaxID=2487334 RepID=UPI0020CD43F6|nr:hypothetical protein [Ferruginibacter sp. HRS2-29]MCP9751212.1 hypothetical protein [Ferruginibacter sp. HRS2-29]
MKKAILLLIISFAAVSGFSQIQRKVVKDTSASLAKTKESKKQQLKQLDLTKEQKGKIKEMRKANKDSKDAIMNDETLTDEQKKSKVDSMKRGNARKMQGVLTDEQKQKWKEMRKKKGQ